jgi:PAS domain S-box-containing protein
MSLFFKILILEDNPADIEFVRRELRNSGMEFELNTVVDKKGFMDALDNFVPDVILSDHTLPQFNAIEALEIVNEKKLDIPFIMVTGSVNEEFAAKIIKLGADDFIMKKSLAKLPAAIITSRKLIKQEAELKKSEERYYSLFNAVPDAIFISDTKGNFTEANENALQLLGYTQSELIAANIKDIIHENETPQLAEAFQKIQTSNSCVRQWQLKKKDGTYFYAEISNSLDSDGYMIATVRDISDRKLAEEKLKYSQDQNNAILNAIPDMIFVINKDGIFKNYINPKDEKTYLPPENFLNKNILDLLPPDLANTTLNNVKKNLANEIIPAHQYSLPYPDGVKYYEAKYAKMNEEEVLIIVRNITIEKLADQRIIDSEEKYRTLIERVSDAFVALDKNWIFTYVNKKAGEILGRDAESLVGKHVWTEFPEAMEHPFFKAYYKAMDEQAYQYFEDFYPPYNKWFENHIYPSPEGLTIYFKDITEKKMAEKVIQTSRQQLEFISDHIPYYIAQLDTYKKYLFVNKPYASLFNMDPEDFYGKYVYEVLGEEYFASVKPHMDIALSGNAESYAIKLPKSFKAETKSLEKISDIEVSYIPEFDEQKKVTGFIVAIADITEIKKAEEKVQRLNEELEERVKERTAELLEANKDLEEVNELFVGNEIRIIELKEELEALKNKAAK